MCNKIIFSCTYNRYRCFIEYIKSIIVLNKYLKDLKIEFIFTENIQYNDKMFFLFLWEIPEKYKTYKNIILLNTEQLSRNDIINHEYIKKVVVSNTQIIDYSIQNSNILKNLNKLSHHLPYQYDSNDINNLKSLIENSEKEYDIVIIGTPSPYRNHIINNLIKNKLKVCYINNTFQNTRDLEISKSKILLNLHYNDSSKIYEHLRCDRWIFSGMLVISENTIDNECLDIKDLIIFDKYENLIDKVKCILENYNAYYKQFTENLTKMLPNIIESRKNTAIELLNNIVLIK